MLHLKIIIASTRPGRKGEIVANWFVSEAQKNAQFTVDVLDLEKINLPFLDEPQHPRLQQYTHDHTKAWSLEISSADAFVVVLPEYNFSMPAPLVNAVDYLLHEWYYKPVGFVSYGGISGGTRSLQMAKQLFSAVGVMPLPESVILPFFTEQIKDDVFIPTEKNQKSAQTMLSELELWAEGLKEIRNKKKQS